MCKRGIIEIQRDKMLPYAKKVDKYYSDVSSSISLRNKYRGRSSRRLKTKAKSAIKHTEGADLLEP